MANVASRQGMFIPPGHLRAWSLLWHAWVPIVANLCTLFILNKLRHWLPLVVLAFFYIGLYRQFISFLHFIGPGGYINCDCSFFNFRKYHVWSRFWIVRRQVLNCWCSIFRAYRLTKILRGTRYTIPPKFSTEFVWFKRVLHVPQVLLTISVKKSYLMKLYNLGQVKNTACLFRFQIHYTRVL
jgi:hypothetical protein